MYAYAYALAPSDVDGGWEIMRHGIVNGAMRRKNNQKSVDFEYLHPEHRFVYGWKIRCRTRTTHFAGDRGTQLGYQDTANGPWMSGKCHRPGNN